METYTLETNLGLYAAQVMVCCCETSWTKDYCKFDRSYYNEITKYASILHCYDEALRRYGQKTIDINCEDNSTIESICKNAGAKIFDIDETVPGIGDTFVDDEGHMAMYIGSGLVCGENDIDEIEIRMDDNTNWKRLISFREYVIEMES